MLLPGIVMGLGIAAVAYVAFFVKIGDQTLVRHLQDGIMSTMPPATKVTLPPVRPVVPPPPPVPRPVPPPLSNTPAKTPQSLETHGDADRKALNDLVKDVQKKP